MNTKMKTCTKTWAVALALGSTLVAGTSREARADSFRWPWEQREADRKNDDRRAPPSPRGPTTTTGRENGPLPPSIPQGRNDRGPDVSPDRNRDRDRQFLDMMFSANAQEIALAEETRRATHDRDVRFMAERTIDELSSFQSTLERRAAQLGYRLRPVPVWRLNHRGAAQDDVAWMRAAMDIVAGYRPRFANYKSDTDRAFHDVLQHHWDEMVDRRDDIKALHDEVRNEDRRRAHHNG